MSARARIAWGGLLLVSLGLHAGTKWVQGVSLQEMLYGCHLATLIMAVGFVLSAERLITVGFIFHLGIGFPAWILEIIAHGTTPSSVLVHLAPIAAGVFAMKFNRVGWSDSWRSWVFFLGTQALAIAFTDPSLDVNVVFAPFGDMGRVLPTVMALRLFNAVAGALCLTVAVAVVRFVKAWFSGRGAAVEARSSS